MSVKSMIRHDPANMFAALGRRPLIQSECKSFESDHHRIGPRQWLDAAYP